MKISVITVAYNSEDSIGQTIESVLGQTGLERPGCDQEESTQAETAQIESTRTAPVQTESTWTVSARKYELEYLIIDGKSSDRTVEIAESYREALERKGVTYRVISEPDRGIYDAMNKGIRLAEGDVIGILNSDDQYEPDTLETVADTFEREKCDLMYANIRMHRADGSTFVKRARLRRFETSRDWNHPTTFVQADLYKEYPFRNLGIHDDYGFFLQMKGQGRRIVTVDKVLADFHMGGASNRKDLREAGKRIRDRYRYCYRINGYSRWYLLECVAIEAAKLLLG